MGLNFLKSNKGLVDKLRVYKCSPKTADADGVLTSKTLPTTAQLVAPAAQPDLPRALSITGAMAGASLTGNVVIYGLDANGNPIKETIALSNNTTVNGNKAFKKVNSISLPVRVTLNDAITVGFIDKIGFPEMIDANTVIMATIDGTYEATRPTIAKGTGVSDCTFDLNSALSTGKEAAIYYVAN